MKLLITAIFASMMAVSTSACEKEEPKKAATIIVKTSKAAEPADVKKDDASETKRVCVDIQDKNGKPVIDPRTKKPRQDCRTIKIRKKFEGTKIEDAKKK